MADRYQRESDLQDQDSISKNVIVVEEPVGVTVDKGEVKPLFTNGKQVDWHIPRGLYLRLRELHAFALDKNKVQTPESEHLFAMMMLDDAITRGEAVRAAYEAAKEDKRIIDPFADKQVII